MLEVLKVELPMILEGIVTTQNEDGSTNVSPMGPIVDECVTSLRLRPFQTSTTYANLKRTRQGIFHVTDDSELLARAAIDAFDSTPALKPCQAVQGMILAEACRWYAFTVDSLDDRNERTDITCIVVDQGRLRDFLGWNRAKHAVLEAAILATRVHLLSRDEIRRQYDALRIIVEKTAGESERRAFDLLVDFISSVDDEPPARS